MRKVHIWCAAAAMLVVALLPAKAWAHATLLDADPADGTTLATAPEELTLKFSETLDEGSTRLAVVTPGGANLLLEPARFDGPTVVQPVTLPEVGTYTFSYRIVSVDGHPVEGSLSFTVESVPSGNEDAPLSPSEDVGAAEDDPASGPNWTWFALGGVAVAVGVAVLIIVVPRRR